MDMIKTICCFVFMLCVMAVAVTIQQVPMGGGGYVTGIVIHPLEPTRRYLRTDVGGTYRWDETGRQWRQMSWSMGKNYRQYCTDGIAIDPQDPRVVYICVGNGQGAGTPGIYRTTDEGESWQLLCAAPFFGNSRLRGTGECIQVDPHDSRVIYCGTRGMGLLRTIDGGVNWAAVEGVPVNYSYPKMQAGIRSVAVDASSVTAAGRSARVYAAVYGVGVYASGDGGESWGALAGAPQRVRTIAVGEGGTLYATSDDGVWKCQDGVFTDISPKDGKRVYNALAVASGVAGRLIVCQANTGPQDCMNMKIFFSEDDGRTWRQKNEKIRKYDRPGWWPDYYWSSATAALCFHPQDAKQVWLTDWYGVWQTPDIGAETVDWHAQVRGHEECVTFAAATLPEGPVKLLLGTVDNGLLYYRDIAQYPPSRSSHDIRDIAWCVAEPRRVVMATASDMLLVSDDYGQTQRNVPGPGAGKINKAAVSCGQADNWVVLPNKKGPFYTKDGGKTWKPSVGAGANTMSSKWGRQDILAADGGDGAVFYYAGKDGLYASVDGGAAFGLVNGELKNFVKLTALPGRKGWLGIRGEKRLWLSSDGGRTVRPVAFFGEAHGFAVGRGRSADTPVLYATGVPKDGVSPKGLYVSDDGGEKWTLACGEDKLSLFRLACGDMQQYGRCFLTASGLGAISLTIEN